MRYIEFYSGAGAYYETQPDIYFKGVPSDELIDELSIEVRNKHYDGSEKLYVTTIDKIGQAGWKLECATPFGIIPGTDCNKSGYLRINYIFSKDC